MSFLSQLVEMGTHGYDARTTRRLRLLNGIAIVGIAVCAACLVVVFLLLLLTGQNPFTAGNAILITFIAIYLPTFWLHRFGQNTAAYYQFFMIGAVNFLSMFAQGRVVGGQYVFLILAAVVPLIFPPNQRFHNYFLMLIAVGLVILAELVTPEIGFIMPSDRPVETNTVIRVLVISINAITLCFIVGYAFRIAELAEDALEAEHARSEALLYNLLPEDIAARLKVEPERTIADSLPKVAILFADIVDFTPRASSLPAEEVVRLLNRVFSAFDELADKHGMEKIKTIGDAYMVAAGMPSPVGDPVHRVAEMALDMQRTAKLMSKEFPEGLEVRIGLHAGPAVAGVIGNKKLFYDVWGETVNTASRMESHGEPGRIQVTCPVHEELVGDYNFELRGTVEIKGMGTVKTWWLTGKEPPK